LPSGRDSTIDEPIAESVAQAWTAALAGYVSFTVSLSGCTVDDGTCVNVVDDFQHLLR